MKKRLIIDTGLGKKKYANSTQGYAAINKSVNGFSLPLSQNVKNRTPGCCQNNLIFIKIWSVVVAHEY